MALQRYVPFEPTTEQQEAFVSSAKETKDGQLVLLQLPSHVSTADLPERLPLNESSQNYQLTTLDASADSFNVFLLSNEAKALSLGPPIDSIWAVNQDLSLRSLLPTGPWTPSTLQASFDSFIKKTYPAKTTDLTKKLKLRCFPPGTSHLTAI